MTKIYNSLFYNEDNIELICEYNGFEIRSEIDKWLRENLGEQAWLLFDNETRERVRIDPEYRKEDFRWVRSPHYENSSYGKFSITFLYEDDAMAFKLRWNT